MDTRFFEKLATLLGNGPQPLASVHNMRDYAPNCTTPHFMSHHLRVRPGNRRHVLKHAAVMRVGINTPSSETIDSLGGAAVFPIGSIPVEIVEALRSKHETTDVDHFDDSAGGRATVMPSVSTLGPQGRFDSREWWLDQPGAEACTRVTVSSTCPNTCSDEQDTDMVDSKGIVYPVIILADDVADCDDVDETESLTGLGSVSGSAAASLVARRSVILKRLYNVKKVWSLDGIEVRIWTMSDLVQLCLSAVDPPVPHVNLTFMQPEYAQWDSMLRTALALEEGHADEPVDDDGVKDDEDALSESQHVWESDAPDVTLGDCLERDLSDVASHAAPDDDADVRHVKENGITSPKKAICHLDDHGVVPDSNSVGHVDVPSKAVQAVEEQRHSKRVVPPARARRALPSRSGAAPASSSGAYDQESSQNASNDDDENDVDARLVEEHAKQVAWIERLPPVKEVPSDVDLSGALERRLERTASGGNLGYKLSETVRKRETFKAEKKVKANGKTKTSIRTAGQSWGPELAVPDWKGCNVKRFRKQWVVGVRYSGFILFAQFCGLFVPFCAP